MQESIIMADQILPEGIRFFPKSDKQPDFVLGTMIITLNDLFAWAKAHPELHTEYDSKKQIKFQLLNSKAGKLYAAVDNWKPEAGKQNDATEATDEKLPF